MRKIDPMSAGLLIALGSLAFWTGAVVLTEPTHPKPDVYETVEVWVSFACPDGKTHVAELLSDPVLDGCRDNTRQTIEVEVK